MWKKKWYPPKRNTSYKPRFEEYEREKQAWIAHHPKASGEEYIKAMREIAEQCGI